MKEAPAPQTVTTINNDGRRREVLGIALTNSLLSIPTLLLYRFWGKTRLRRYYWSRIEFDGDRFEYTGTGRELFLGFLIALAVLIPLLMLSYAIDLYVEGNMALTIAAGVPRALVVLFLLQLGYIRGRRYQLSRTLWRGIRAGQTGSTLRYALIANGYWLLTIVTLGLTYPLMRYRLFRRRLSNTYVGTVAFTVNGRARDLVLRWFLVWLIAAASIVAIGMSTFPNPTRFTAIAPWPAGIAVLLLYAWYRAAEFRYLAECLGYGNLRFRSSLSGRSLIGLYLGYFAALVLGIIVVALVATLFVILAAWLIGVARGDLAAALSPQSEVSAAIGILVAVVVMGAVRPVFLVQPLLRRLCLSLTILGTEDFARIAQLQAQSPKRGEGLADALAIGEV